MTERIFQINSLRLNRVFGGEQHSHGYHPEWFYNGSIKFENPTDGPRVFPNLTSAVEYFTEKSYECERVRGQYVTWAEKTTRNWVLYTYIGPDVTDASYSNPKNWLPFGEAISEPYTMIQENITATKGFEEKMNAHYSINEQLDVKQD